MENDLDKLEDPRYEWFPFEIYRNWDGYQLTPVIASRGVAGHGAPSAQSAFTGGLETPKVCRRIGVSGFSRLSFVYV